MPTTGFSDRLAASIVDPLDARRRERLVGAMGELERLLGAARVMVEARRRTGGLIKRVRVAKSARGLGIAPRMLRKLEAALRGKWVLRPCSRYEQGADRRTVRGLPLALPREPFPPRSTVYNIFRKYRRECVWTAILKVSRGRLSFDFGRIEEVGGRVRRRGLEEVGPGGKDDEAGGSEVGKEGLSRFRRLARVFPGRLEDIESRAGEGEEIECGERHGEIGAKLCATALASTRRQFAPSSAGPPLMTEASSPSTSLSCSRPKQAIWLPDPSDRLAARLARDGDPNPSPSRKPTPASKSPGPEAIASTGRPFAYTDRHSRRVTTILGYPTQLLADAQRR